MPLVKKKRHQLRLLWDFFFPVDTHVCKLCVMPRSRVMLRVLFNFMKDIWCISVNEGNNIWQLWNSWVCICTAQKFICNMPIANGIIHRVAQKLRELQRGNVTETHQSEKIKRTRERIRRLADSLAEVKESTSKESYYCRYEYARVRNRRGID